MMFVGHHPTPEKVDATIIQAAPPERFLARKQSRIFKQGLFAQAGFYAAKNHGKALYCEFFLEGNN